MKSTANLPYARQGLAQTVIQLDWRVSQLADALSLTEQQTARVRIILANAMARRAAGDEEQAGVSAAERIESLLTREQRVRFAALIHEGRLLLPDD